MTTLLEILVKELNEWPLVDGIEAKVIVQDGNSKLVPYIEGDMRFEDRDNRWLWNVSPSFCDTRSCWKGIPCSPLSSDYKTAKITKQMWEDEKKKMSYKQFTKDDLKPGMVCTLRNGDIFIVVGNCNFYGIQDGPTILKDAYNGNFKWSRYGIPCHLLDIMEITYGNETVFIREEKSEQQKALEEAEKELAKLQESAKMIEQNIKKLKENT